jgi:L-cysteine:1D-myo-inositol 2-amino-2-deoxy-alpha-D-glucopyranoside ligase
MQLQPWPNLYMPAVPAIFPHLTLKSTYGIREFGPQTLKSYVCGITPYDSTHLGHAATYITFDLIHRYIKASGGEVLFVENVTDIDEPLLERAARDNQDWKTLALNQVQLFQSDMVDLHVLPPEYFVPATSVMELVDEAISAMDRNGYVYKVENDLYFSIEDFLVDLPISSEEALNIFGERGGDPSRPGKRHPLDPVLWWANKNGEPGWESSHGYGRPGWHIECCVISLRYLLGADYLSQKGVGPLIDIQGGGTDLIFPHHFMSAAQAQAMTGRNFAKAYVHSGMVGLNGEKMSKSKGNLVFVSKLVNAGVDPMAIRLALLQSHYQDDRMWNDEALEMAVQLVNRIRLNLGKMEVAPATPLIHDLISALSDNLDTPRALNRIKLWCEESETNPCVDEGGLVARALDSLLGLAL